MYPQTVIAFAIHVSSICYACENNNNALKLVHSNIKLCVDTYRKVVFYIIQFVFIAVKP